MTSVSFAAIVIAFAGIGAILVLSDHPWFGLLAFLMAGSCSMGSMKD